MVSDSASSANEPFGTSAHSSSATPDAEHTQKPPLPELPYRPYPPTPDTAGDALYTPYAETPAPHEPPYKPYDRKSTLPELPYEPYKDI